MLVELTTSKKELIYINPAHVVRVEWHDDEYAKVYVTGKDTYIGVKGNATQVAQRLSR